MTTKKKPRPLFEVPAEVESGAQSGWVYRSGADMEPPPRVEMTSREADSSVPDESAVALAMTLAALAQVMALGMTIAAIPWTMGLRTLQSFTKQSD
jgi:hypothetical protein